MPHRIELWDDLERIKSAGYKEWLKAKGTQYSCPQCGTLNSTYDAKCRKCGQAPSCPSVAEHQKAIEAFKESQK